MRQPGVCGTTLVIFLTHYVIFAGEDIASEVKDYA